MRDRIWALTKAVRLLAGSSQETGNTRTNTFPAMNLAYTSMLTMEWSAVVNGHGLSLAILLLSSSVAMCTYEGNGNPEYISKSFVFEESSGGKQGCSQLILCSNVSGRTSFLGMLACLSSQERIPMREPCMCSFDKQKWQHCARAAHAIA